MPRILFINSVCGFGSTGKIVVSLASSEGFDSLICYGRKENSLYDNSYCFSKLIDNSFAAAQTILLNNNLSICVKSTRKLIKKIKEFSPDIIHLHNLHGYYLNVEMLFSFLKEYKKPIVWTLHDCWAFTGYCCHYDFIECNKFKTTCKKCPHGFSYPFSLFKQGVEKDFFRKKQMFTSLNNLTIVTPSEWLKNQLSNSFLFQEKVITINNGIDLPKKVNQSKKKDFSILAVSNYWTREKGIDELKKIIPLLNSEIKITIVGSLKDKNFPHKNCTLIERTENFEELSSLYSSHHLFINPTLQDNYPTVNIEAFAHGLPIVTYNTGGSPEVIDNSCGCVIEKYDHVAFADKINELYRHYPFDSNSIIEHSKKFSKEIMLDKYKKLYHSLLEDQYERND